ncbi:GNAT family N-acetyltransferase [Clostridium sp. Marseille-P299]|uniref:GNAT family N-acetyltransferase n=1 Tax=Clostridium sp. Marseille-P299 TaxID=1805477 RepID=UPI00082D811E|nr:GNAT family N-acetyltransferase [Clostridium sp. Marseille-P299]
MVHLVDINHNNWRESLMVSEEQTSFVSDTYRIMARAYAFKEHRSQAKFIYKDETPIGMLMFYDCEELEGYDLSQLFIDRRYQRKGYGSKATELVLQWMRQDRKYDKVYLCYIEGNEAAKAMYLELGFRHTDEIDGDEIIMVLDL